MTDVATIWDPNAFAGDWSLSNGDLVTDNGLQTAVEISLLTDRQANADDVIPDGSTDRRGWWGDLPLPGEPTNADGSSTDPIGSRLWLLSRAKATPATALLAQDYCQEALQWLVDQGIAQQVLVETVWISDDKLGVTVDITRQLAGGAPVNHVFDLTWSATVAQVSGPATVSRPLLPPPTAGSGTTTSSTGVFGESTWGA